MCAAKLLRCTETRLVLIDGNLLHLLHSLTLINFKGLGKDSLARR